MLLIVSYSYRFLCLLVLVEQGYLKDKKFISYLQYLLYLSHPPFSSLLQYPNGLEILRLLNRSEFRKHLTEATGSIVDYIHKQQYHHWVHFSDNGEGRELFQHLYQKLQKLQKFQIVRVLGILQF